MCAGRCHADFVPLNWFGRLDGLAARVQWARTTFPDLKVWVIEWGPAALTLEDTKTEVAKILEYLDKEVDRHAYRGSLRSNIQTNLGPNAAMFDAEGKLTDVGKLVLDVKK